jgi:signal peptidase I
VTEPEPTTSEHDQADADPQRRPVVSDDLPGVVPQASTAPTLPAPPAPGPVAKTDDEQPFWRWLVEFVVLVGLAVLLAMGIKAWVVQPFFIPSGSMIHTLEINDRVLVNKFIYRFGAPKPGNVVVFAGPVGPSGTDEDLIKRVIAVGGQTVDIRDGYVYVNGKKLDEPYVTPANRDKYTLPAPVKIPAGYIWVMGDNRGNSADSRVIGPQPVSRVLGQAFVIYWPIDRLRGL